MAVSGLKLSATAAIFTLKPHDMKHLYWKIFLWFWVANVITLVITVLLTQQVVQTIQDATSPNWETLASEVVMVYESGGEMALEDWQRQQRMNVFLLNEFGLPINERPLPRPVRNHLALLSDNDNLTHTRLPNGETLACVTQTGMDGMEYRVVTYQRPDGRLAFPTSRRGPVPSLPPVRQPMDAWWKAGPVTIRTAISILVIGILCFFISRRLTRPLVRLQNTAREFAAGDLSARVGDTNNRQDEIGQLSTEFDHMAERLQRLVEGQRQLLRDVSHELRSPLARLQVALELARSGNTNQLDRVEREAVRINELIEDILTLARLDEPSSRLHTQPCNLNQLLTGLIADAEFEAAQKKVTIQTALPDKLILPADANLLSSAIDNVLRNAVHYAPANSAIMVKGTLTEGTFTLTIRDYGPGVPEDDLPRVFEPFFRVSTARDRQSGGHGIGLAIVERAIRAHGGHVSAENAAGGGLQITVTLPLAAP